MSFPYTYADRRDLLQLKKKKEDKKVTWNHNAERPAFKEKKAIFFLFSTLRLKAAHTQDGAAPIANVPPCLKGMKQRDNLPFLALL